MDQPQEIRNNIVSRFASYIGIVMTLFLVVVLNFKPIEASKFRTIYLLCICLMVFLIYDRKGKKTFTVSLDKVVLIAASFFSIIYAFFQLEEILRRGGISTTRWDLIAGTVAVLVVLEATRRTIGNALPLISIFFIAYTFLGRYIPGFLGHNGYNYKRIITALYTYDGIFGTPLDVGATFVAMFLVFGGFLEVTGAGDFFLQLSMALAGRQRGGPAKIATVASGFFGSISGSAVANVVGTGTFTIPLMKKIGYERSFAGAVEAAASTGGQIMPPVMAAGAFLMAEILGVPYLQIIKAAIIPAILYFIIIWITVDLRAAKTGLSGLQADQVPDWRIILKRQGFMLVPLFILIYSLVIVRQSPIRAAFWSLLCCLVIMLLQQKDLKKSLRITKDALYNSALAITAVAPAAACAGLVISAIGLTGLGLKIAAIIISVSKGSLWLGLILSMVTAIIFGMGLPTTVSYILCATILAPPLIQMGILPIAAHMFIFYFACLSGITPPVAMAAFAAASIAESDPMSTGFMACRLAAAGFILPYIFVYNPIMLMQGSVAVGQLALSICTALIGCYALGAASEGWLYCNLNRPCRIVLAAAALSLINPGFRSDAFGLVCFLGVVAYQYNLAKKRPMHKGPTHLGSPKI